MRNRTALLLSLLLLGTAVVASARPKIDDDASYPEVAQREYLITDAKHAARIETSALDTCVGLTLYDRQTRTGLLAHFDAPTRRPESLARVFLEFTRRGIPLARLEARVIGGQTETSDYSPSTELSTDLLAALAKEGIPVVEKDLGGVHVIRSILLDLNTGNVYDFDDTLAAEPWEVGEAKRNRLWDAALKRFCDGYLYRHEASLPSVGVPTEQPADRQCF